MFIGTNLPIKLQLQDYYNFSLIPTKKKTEIIRFVFLWSWRYFSTEQHTRDFEDIQISINHNWFLSRLSPLDRLYLTLSLLCLVMFINFKLMLTSFQLMRDFSRFYSIICEAKKFELFRLDNSLTATEHSDWLSSRWTMIEIFPTSNYRNALTCYCSRIWRNYRFIHYNMKHEWMSQ